MGDAAVYLTAGTANFEAADLALKGRPTGVNNLREPPGAKSKVEISIHGNRGDGVACRGREAPAGSATAGRRRLKSQEIGGGKSGRAGTLSSHIGGSAIDGHP